MTQYSITIRDRGGRTYDYDHIAAVSQDEARQRAIRTHVASGNAPGWIIRTSAP